MQQRARADALQRGDRDCASDQEESYRHADTSGFAEPRINRRSRSYVSIQYRSQAEECDEPGPLDFGFRVTGERGCECKGDDPKRAGQLNGGADGQSSGAVFGGGSHDRTGVVDGEGDPKGQTATGLV